MGLKITLVDKILFVDTAPFIYYIEGSSQYNEKLKSLFDLNANGEVLFYSSTLTLLELLVKPLKLGEKALANQYEDILTNSSNIHIYEISVEISKKAAELRAKYNLKTPDSIQISTGIVKGADYVLTNDSELKRVKEIKVLVLDDL